MVRTNRDDDTRRIGGLYARKPNADRRGRGLQSAANQVGPSNERLLLCGRLQELKRNLIP